MIDKRAHWEEVYTKKSSREVSWFQPSPEVSLKLIENCGGDPESHIIDVGGGASCLVDNLVEKTTSRVSVLDISGKSLSVAKERLGEKSGKVKWLVKDVTKFKSPNKFKLWHDRAVFHFLTDKSDRARYVENLKASLDVGGCAVLATFAIGGPEKCSGLPIVQYDSKKICNELGREFRLVEELEELHETPSGSIQKFIYFRFIRE
jgi:SAM-dependent methyltransferase